MGTGLILTHQPAETGHIRVQDRSEFSLPRAELEDFGHRPRPQMISGILGLAHITNALTPQRSTRTILGFGKRDEQVECPSAPGRTPCSNFIHRARYYPQHCSGCYSRQSFHSPPAAKSSSFQSAV